MPNIAQPMSAAQMAQQAAQANFAARNAVVNQSVEMKQPIAAATIYPAQNPTFTTPPRWVGLGKRFIVEITATIANTGNTQVALTDFGLANLISQVQFTDTSNYLRITTTGIHLALLACAKRRRPYAASLQANTFGGGGQNESQMLNVPPASWPILQGPSTIAAGANATVRGVFEIPLAYSDDDLRGAIYFNLINASATLQVTLNTNPITANPADNTFAIYSGAAGSAGSITSANINVTQVYLDQLPVGKGGVILPTTDLSTIYELKNIPIAALAQNQENSIPYTNFRSFLSTFAIYNNNGGYNGRVFGSDLNYWSLKAANMTELFRLNPLLAAMTAREEMMIDLPAGTYYFPSRRSPINTAQVGNMNLIANPSSYSAGGYVNVMFEDMGVQNTLVNAAALGQ